MENSCFAYLFHSVEPGDIADSGLARSTVAGVSTVAIALFAARGTLTAMLQLGPGAVATTQPVWVNVSETDADFIAALTPFNYGRPATIAIGALDEGARPYAEKGHLFRATFNGDTAGVTVGVLALRRDRYPRQVAFLDVDTSDSVTPIILRASDYDGRNLFTVGDHTYHVVGVWEETT